MTAKDSLDHLESATWLRDNPVAAHLGSNETVQHVLTNREVGLRREEEDEEIQIPPAEDCGAVAVLSDRRILFLVGDPPDRQGDLAESVPYESIAQAIAETEMLTQRVLVEAGDSTYSFTARETAAVEDVQTFLTTAAGVYAGCEDHLDGAAAARDRLETEVDDRAWDDCDDAINEARVALGDANALIEGTPFDPLRDRVGALTAEIDELARVRHRRHAEELAEECESLLDDHEYEQSHERLTAARHHVDAAHTLVDDAAAADGGHGGGGVAVEATQDRIETLEASLQSRPVEDAEEYYERGTGAEDRADRIEALEAAFDCYRSAASLLADDDTPFEGDEGAARDDAERVIGDLIEARLEAAEAERAAGEWEREADNPESAHELLATANEHASRALELANAYPPGDVATIEAECERIEELLDPLRIEVELSTAELDDEAAEVEE